MTPKTQQKQADAFTRFKELQAKAQRQVIYHLCKEILVDIFKGFGSNFGNNSTVFAFGNKKVRKQVEEPRDDGVGI